MTEIIAKTTQVVGRVLSTDKFTIQELLDLQSIYNMIMGDHKDLVTLAVAHDISVAEAYYDCKIANELLAGKVKELEAKNKAELKAEMVANELLAGKVKELEAKNKAELKAEMVD
jgi:hypothetical protein